MNYSAKMRFYRTCFMVHLEKKRVMGRAAQFGIDEDLKYWLNELDGLGGVW